MSVSVFSGQMETFWGFLLYDKLQVYDLLEAQVITHNI